MTAEQIRTETSKNIQFTSDIDSKEFLKLVELGVDLGDYDEEQYEYDLKAIEVCQKFIKDYCRITKSDYHMFLDYLFQ